MRLFPALLLVYLVRAHKRLCESGGSCRQCADSRYSYYRCVQQEDCFLGELCDRGFCCPIIRPIVGLQNETPSITQRTARDPSVTVVNSTANTEDLCPDGSDWTRHCRLDDECNTNMEMCAEGKCCATCARQRRLFLDKFAQNELLGLAIPQCEHDGRWYRKRQCLAGTEACWCVTPLGRRFLGGGADCETRRRKQENLALKAVKLRDELIRGKVCEEYRDGDCPSSSVGNATVEMPCLCDSDCPKTWKCCEHSKRLICLAPVSPIQPMTLICAANEQFSACHSPCQPSCDDPTLAPCPPPTCTPGCHCQPGFIRADGSPRSACVPRAACAMYDATTRCLDERRQYHSCGSACPISCATRNAPRCQESCVSGCFCRIPYVLENGNDPLHSRCILPSQCPLINPTIRQSPLLPAISPVQNKKTLIEFYPTPGAATVLPDTNHCSDPLKNYLNCGTKCPVGCNDLNPSTTCSLACVSGCFCRSPYILLDAKDPQSSCVLPLHCPRTTSPTGTCARSCTNPLGRCEAGLCSAGCVCREPYVLQDPMDPSSRCVLPSECERKCNDPLKEFIVCGSSCPVGCDNRRPQSCTPCESGCFCKNGLVFLNSTDWRNSDCVRFDECPDFTQEKSEQTTVESITTISESANTDEKGLVISNLSGIAVVTEVSTVCPAVTLDVGGRSCATDADCPDEQRCCRPVILSLAVNPQRCTCPDPNAIWTACGSLCPEYCGQPGVPHCSSTCNPGCHCAPGYVKSRNDVTAPCVPQTQCQNITSAITNSDEPRATMKEIPVTPKDPFSDQQLATANLIPSQKLVSGRFSFTQISASNLRISGVLSGLPRGEHAVLIHQFGDLSDGCSHLGPPFIFKGGMGTPSLGDVVVDDSSTATFDRVVDWPITDVVGRSIAIYRLSTTEYSLHNKNETPLACGTIGLTAFT
uniref:Thyroglobulin type-1 domain-containing protein n=1 Tax=Haemonchus contortus TaxID=6289 RepID=A0A7I4YUS5_HAECO